MRSPLLLRMFLWFTIIFAFEKIKAQQYDCYFKPPVVTIDFGSGNVHDPNSIALPEYRRDFSFCPNDGFYSFTFYTSNCFNNDWFTINGDHTGTGQNGNMMLVNASERGGIFLNTALDGLTGNTTYQITLWMMNVCRINGGCAPLPPNITISILTPDGIQIGSFATGILGQGPAPVWRKFYGFFETPSDVTSLTLRMEDNTLGGCGNDFAVDDITIRECMIPKPVLKNESPVVVQNPEKKEPSPKQVPVVKMPVVKNIPEKKEMVKRDTTHIISKQIQENKPVFNTPVIKDKPVIRLPEVILTRANPIVKQIESDAGELQIELYDNGEIDGDTVSVYHNNKLIVSGAALSDKPVSFHFMLDKTQPHHELVMVANNLGSIPPNTSMMIITVNTKRYEIFISSSEQKNAKIVIDLKE